MIPALPLRGACRCGAVRLTVTAPPLITSACHCRGCQRMTASAYSLSILLLDAGLAVEGETVLGGPHGPEQRHHHCARCLSWLFTRIEGMPEIVNLRATMLDDLAWFVPFLETATDEALPFARLDAPRAFASLPPAADFPDLMAAFAAQSPFAEETSHG